MANSNLRPAAKTGEDRTCEQCGAIFYVPKARLDKARFCSGKCHGQSRIGKEVITERQEALARNERFYFSKTPCPKGHVGARYVSCHRCVECAKDEMAQKRAATARRRAVEPKSPRQKAKAAGETRYLTGKPCSRGHYAERETVNGACIECTREQRAAREVENAEVKDNRKIYRQKNAERYRSHTRNRRILANGGDGKHTERDVDSLWDKQRGRCAYCSCRLDAGYHVDHINPLSKGGSNKKSNLQITCQPCNLSKHNKTPEEYARKLGRLI